MEAGAGACIAPFLEQEPRMGIRFFCPQGHRLNVKSFLAGKRGVCPDCGAAVNIPMESDARALSSKKKVAQQGGNDADGGAKATAVLERPEAERLDAERPELDISVLQSSDRPSPNDFALPPSFDLPPMAVPSTVAAVTTLQHVIQPVRPAAVAPVPNGVPLGIGAAPPAPPSVSDPIAEAPMAIWYVRPAAGGQYGPARGDVMRKWVGEGRVTTDSLVWREGWPDWRPSAKVFPDLGSKTPAAASESSPIVSDTPRRPIRPARKASTAQGIGIVITLGVVCVALFIALLWVLSNTGAGPTP